MLYCFYLPAFRGLWSGHYIPACIKFKHRKKRVTQDIIPLDEVEPSHDKVSEAYTKFRTIVLLINLNVRLGGHVVLL